MDTQSPRISTRSLIVLGIILIIICVLAFLAYWQRAALVETIQGINTRMHMNGAYTLSGSGTDVTVIRHGIFGDSKVTAKSGTIVDFAHSSNGSYALVLSPNGHDEDVVALNASEKKLTSDGGIKAALAVSSDGRYISYTQFTPKDAHQQMPTDQLADWSVSILDTHDSSAMVFKSAYAPHFYSSGGKSYVEFMVPAGMGITDLAKKQTLVMNILGNSTISHPTYVSPTGNYALVFSTLGKRYAAFSLDSKFPPIPTPIVTNLGTYSTVIGIDGKGFYVPYSAHGTAELGYVLLSNMKSPVWAYQTQGAAIVKLIP